LRQAIETDSVGSACGLALAGVGATVLPVTLVQADLRAGRLVHLLPDLPLWTPGIFAVWPNNVAPESPALRFVRFMADRTGRATDRVAHGTASGKGQEFSS